MEGHREDGGDTLPETDPRAEDVLGGGSRPHIPLRSTRVPFEDHSDEFDDVSEDDLWGPRIRQGIKFLGRITRELGTFLSRWDEWELLDMVAREPEPRRPDPFAPGMPEAGTRMALHIRSLHTMVDGKWTHFDTESKRPNEIEIPPGAHFEMCGRPQAIYKPRRLHISVEDAKDLLVADIKIGRNSQFVASGEIPAVAFALPEGGPCVTEAAQVSMDVVVILMHVGKEPRHVPLMHFSGVVAE